MLAEEFLVWELLRGGPTMALAENFFGVSTGGSLKQVYRNPRGVSLPHVWSERLPSRGSTRHRRLIVGAAVFGTNMAFLAGR